MDSEAVRERKKRQAEPASEAGASSLPPVALNEKIHILPGQKIAHLSHAGAAAYAARNLEDGSALFAMLCGKAVVPRINSIASYKGVNSQGLLQIVESRVVNWPLENVQKLALVFEMPPGPPFMVKLEDRRAALSDDMLTRTVLTPLIEVLRTLHNTDMVHGAIRPTNIFQGGSPGSEIAILGECLSAPPSYTQPAVFEPIERAMAQPSGRGTGAREDDIYSLGVTVAMLLRGRNRLAGMSDYEIIQEKIEQGSYAALLGNDRLSARFTEFMRGVLSDDPEQRWDIDDITKWQEGRHQSTKLPKIQKKSVRAFDFSGEKMWNARAVALALNSNVTAGAQAIDDGHVSQWVRRSLEDGAVHKRLEWAIESAKGTGAGAGYQSRLIARVSAALDPAAPLCYKEVRILPQGVGTALAECIAKSGDVKTFAEIINQQLINFWFSIQPDVSSDAVSLSTLFDSCRGFLRQTMLGYGIERALYFLCDDVPCLSPVFKNFYVISPGDILLAYEAISQSDQRPECLIDRHIAAFLAVRDKKVVKQKSSLLGDEDKATRNLAALLVFAEIQRRYRTGPLPGLSRWFGDILKPALSRYHNSNLRRMMEKEIEKIKGNGDLIALATIVDNAQNSRADHDGFAMAVHEYAILAAEHEQMTKKIQTHGRKIGLRTGQEISAAISGISAALIISGFIFITFIGRL